jgi:hypothetical protein
MQVKAVRSSPPVEKAPSVDVSEIIKGCLAIVTKFLVALFPKQEAVDLGPLQNELESFVNQVSCEAIHESSSSLPAIGVNAVATQASSSSVVTRKSKSVNSDMNLHETHGEVSDDGRRVKKSRTDSPPHAPMFLGSNMPLRRFALGERRSTNEMEDGATTFHPARILE